MKNEQAKVTIQLDRILGTVDPKIFGHFSEHAFANIYGGIYDPGNPLSDEDGHRKDVLELLRRVNVPLLRYPGGNFASNYHWEDGVGPKESRKRVFEYAWLTEESNQFGTVEFIQECRKVGAEPYICVNMGSGTVEEAMHWVEYCNGTGDTYYANLRRSHGYEEPFNVKYWGLGNEMYGDWQMEKLSAEAYAIKALEFAKAMRWIDPEIKLVACGLQSDCDWNTAAMKKLFSVADYISAHHYAVGWGPFERNNYIQNLYIPKFMENLNKMVLASIITAQNDADCKVKVAWDEWNQFGWLVDGVNDDTSYDLHDAIVTALILNFFIKNCDTIGIGNYSTFININGALHVEKDGVVVRPQYYTFELLANQVSGKLADTYVRCGGYDIEVPAKASRRGAPKTDSLTVTHHEEFRDLIPYIDASTTIDDNGEICITIINKHADKDIDVKLEFYGDEHPAGKAAVYSIYSDNVRDCNTREDPEHVKTEKLEDINAGRKMKFTARKHSVNVLRMKKA